MVSVCHYCLDLGHRPRRLSCARRAARETRSRSSKLEQARDRRRGGRLARSPHWVSALLLLRAEEPRATTSKPGVTASSSAVFLPTSTFSGRAPDRRVWTLAQDEAWWYGGYFTCKACVGQCPGDRLRVSYHHRLRSVLAGTYKLSSRSPMQTAGLASSHPPTEHLLRACPIRKSRTSRLPTPARTSMAHVPAYRARQAHPP
ncbi:uncharacterized protein C8Q71DRAFT_408663 [Rhodofomes roseus]|uniref:4Fe-4S ferredoxin-type domain-containing protein n=1 Tax=Rhodofomes roseus TaxID=34475 RepID=A0ABQ8JZ63_9APHY|nr:uncharacterized protein C8Q71DRAFT_408663 [Rhodofomes roseus]KAH9829366.1 hypothetical protein C8Q71DRAFT_408663 [Rhodofomes roseus]